MIPNYFCQIEFQRLNSISEQFIINIFVPSLYTLLPRVYLSKYQVRPISKRIINRLLTVFYFLITIIRNYLQTQLYSCLKKSVFGSVFFQTRRTIRTIKQCNMTKNRVFRIYVSETSNSLKDQAHASIMISIWSSYYTSINV